MLSEQCIETMLEMVAFAELQGKSPGHLVVDLPSGQVLRVDVVSKQDVMAWLRGRGPGENAPPER